MFSSRICSEYAISTATRPHPATRIWAMAAQRSRKIESATIGPPFGLLSKTRIANTNAVTKPAAQIDAEAARREVFGQKTATSIRIPAAPIIESEGEIANQSTCGFTDPAPGAGPAGASAQS